MKDRILVITSVAATCCSFFLAGSSFAEDQHSTELAATSGTQAAPVAAEEDVEIGNIASHGAEDLSVPAEATRPDFVPTFDSILALKTKARDQQGLDADGVADVNHVENSGANERP